MRVRRQLGFVVLSRASRRELDEPEDGCLMGGKGIDEEECVYEPTSSASAVKNCCQLHFCESMLSRAETLLQRPNGLRVANSEKF
jgi:hypothetical protein